MAKATSLAGHYGLKSAGGALVSPFWVSKEAQAGDGLQAALDTKVQEYVNKMGGNKFIRKVRTARAALGDGCARHAAPLVQCC